MQHAHEAHTEVGTWPSDSQRRLLWKIAAVCLVVFLLGAAAVWHHHGSLHIEQQLTRWLVGPVPDPPTLSLRRLRSVPLYLMILPGEPVVFLAMIAVLGKTAWVKGDARLAGVCALGPVLAILFTDVVAKPIVHRSLRDGIAYPSGHTTAATALAVSTYLLLQRVYGPAISRRIAPLLLAAPFITGFGLLALHWHVLLDIPGGLAVGTGVMCAVAALVLPKSKPVENRGLLKDG